MDFLKVTSNVSSIRHALIVNFCPWLRVLLGCHDHMHIGTRALISGGRVAVHASYRLLPVCDVSGAWRHQWCVQLRVCVGSNRHIR